MLLRPAPLPPVECQSAAVPRCTDGRAIRLQEINGRIPELRGGRSSLCSPYQSKVAEVVFVVSGVVCVNDLSKSISTAFDMSPLISMSCFIFSISLIRARCFSVTTWLGTCSDFDIGAPAME
mmetsp:Transcript_49551/g.103375  ORF Transcript_49551/g.103375 Transcript_49551/m.103375 type:complete len:122 (+) Transcript_49551:155-520(+)